MGVGRQVGGVVVVGSVASHGPSVTSFAAEQLQVRTGRAAVDHVEQLVGFAGELSGAL